MRPGIFTVCRHDPAGVVRLAERMQPSVVKAFNHVTSGPWWADIAKAAPAAMRILVPAWITDNLDLSSPEADAESVAAYVDGNPGVPRRTITKNEVRYCTDSRALWDLFVDYLCRYLRRAHALGLDSVVGQINSGHPFVSLIDDVDQWQWLAPVEAEMSGGDAWGLHEYWNESGPDENWPWTAGRHMRCPTKHRIVIDEIGFDYSVGRPPGHYDPRGWNGRLDPDVYVGQLVRYHQMLADPRVVGTCVFLFDYEDRQWHSFDCMPLQDRVLARIGDCEVTDPSMRLPARLAHPVPGAPITVRFGARNQYTSFHLGLDFSAVQGTPVLAAAEGVVDKVLDLGDKSYGRYVTINHGWGFTLYAHLSAFSVAKGDRVGVGQRIGLSGNTGYSFGGHVHFEVQALTQQANQGRVDPYPLIFGGVNVDPIAEAVGAAAQQHVIPLNPATAFEKAGALRGYLPASKEFDTVVSGVPYRAQVYRAPNQRDKQFVVYARVGDWGNLIWAERAN